MSEKETKKRIYRKILDKVIDIGKVRQRKKIDKYIMYKTYLNMESIKVPFDGEENVIFEFLCNILVYHYMANEDEAIEEAVYEYMVDRSVITG